MDKYCVSKYACMHTHTPTMHAHVHIQAHAYMRTHLSSMHMCTFIGAERLDHFKKYRPSLNHFTFLTTKKSGDEFSKSVMNCQIVDSEDSHLCG